MDTLECIVTRRSVRKFNDKPVSKEDIQTIIKSAQYAPSAHNKQPWEFVVVDDKIFLEGLPRYQKWTAFAKDAPLAIIVCGDKNQASHNDELGQSFVDIDCAIATQNMMLSAHALGLGTCFCAAAPIDGIMEGLKEDLNLPEHIRPIAIIVVGHPLMEAKQPDNRYNEEKIHWGQW